MILCMFGESARNELLVLWFLSPHSGSTSRVPLTSLKHDNRVKGALQVQNDGNV